MSAAHPSAPDELIRAGTSKEAQAGDKGGGGICGEWQDINVFPVRN